MNRNYVRKATRKSSRLHNHHGGFIPTTGAMQTHERKSTKLAMERIQGMFKVSKFIHQMNHAYIKKGNE